MNCKNYHESCLKAASLLILWLLVNIAAGCMRQSQPLPEQVVELQNLQSGAGEDDHYRPAVDLNGLFHRVQMQGILVDSKTFVDSEPLSPPKKILREYEQEKETAGFELADFVKRHFELPEPITVDFQVDDDLTLTEHLTSHWDYLVRSNAQTDAAAQWSSLIPLPHPYVVPGGRFREIYYWDSYFTMLGLVRSGESDLMRNMVMNFAWLVERFGFIPNGNRTYYLGRSQPPFFAAMVSLYRETHGTRAAIELLPQMQREHSFWMRGRGQMAGREAYQRLVRMPDGSLLNRYYDAFAAPRPESYREDVLTARRVEANRRPELYRHIRAAAESGWDFSSRWMADEPGLQNLNTTAVVPVDLNSLLYHLELTIARLAEAAGQMGRATAFAAKAHARREAIRKWLWDERSGVFVDWNMKKRKPTGVQSLAMVYPLYFGVATQEQADAVAQVLEQKFLYPGGLVTTLNNTGEQWDFPNGWAPLQWLAVKGLDRYGHTTLATTIAERWLALNRRVFQDTGRMMEKYNVVDIHLAAGGGEYPLQDGFGWTNGVALALLGRSNIRQAAPSD